MTHLQTVVTRVREVADGYLEMGFEWPSFVDDPVPGQFFTLRPGNTSVPLLRRPFAFSAAERNEARFVFERRGKGTVMLAGKRAGDPLDVLGPLGNWFPAPAPERRPVLLAGGIGIGPVVFFAGRLVRRNQDPLLVIGGRTKSRVPTAIVPSTVDHHFCTDDGSLGFCGTPTDFLRDKRSEVLRDAELFICGPKGLLSAGNELAKEWDVPAWVSVEQTMGCAVGACMGCVVRVHGPEEYARVCSEGPVFPSREIVWT
jgi:dihydroorotate dehydrogenase electron transfer subunit